MKYSIVREIVLIGLGEFVRTTASGFTIIILNRALVACGGDLAVAAYGIVLRSMMLVLVPNISVGQGLQPIIGFNYGAKRADRVLKAIKLSILVTTTLSIIAFLILFLLSGPIVRIFTADNSLITASSHALRLVSLAAYLIGFQVVGSVAFQAIGKAVPALLIAISRQVLFLLPLILILPNFFHLDGIWLSFPIADGLSFILTLLLLIPLVKTLKSPGAFGQQQGNS